jgi:multiple sugar transport system permease protein
MATVTDYSGGTKAPPADVATGAKAGGRSDRARSEEHLGWMLAGPALLVMLAVTAYPMDGRSTSRCSATGSPRPRTASSWA